GAGTALSVTNNATIGGTLGVTGTSTLGVVNSGAITTNGNFSQTGGTTFSTGTGAVSLNGNTAVSGTLGVTGTSNLAAVNGSGLFTLAGAGTALSVTN